MDSEMETNLLDFPPDVLRLIVTRLNQGHRLRLSCVSKFLQTLTDPFVRALKFEDIPSTTTNEFKNILFRFTSVTRIVIDSGSLIDVLNAIANSTLIIEDLIIDRVPTCLPLPDQMTSLSSRFGNVRVLKMVWWRNLIGGVVDFIHMFQSLEELDLCICAVLNDAAMTKLASKARTLRKITLHGNNSLTDLSLDALSRCPNLEHISFDGGTFITPQGFCAFVRKMPNMTSMEVPCPPHLIIRKSDLLTVAETMSCCENLSHLLVIKGLLTDALLSVIAKSRSPLTSLVYKHHGVSKFSYTMTGLSVVLRAFHGLTKLHISLPFSGLKTQDTDMSQLVESLVHLKDVSFFSHTTLNATLFSLIHNCPVLKSICLISLIHTNSHCAVNEPQLIRRNCSIRSIGIYPEADPVIKTAVRSVCPSLSEYEWQTRNILLPNLQYVTGCSLKSLA